MLSFNAMVRSGRISCCSGDFDAVNVEARFLNMTSVVNKLVYVQLFFVVATAIST